MKHLVNVVGYVLGSAALSCVTSCSGSVTTESTTVEVWTAGSVDNYATQGQALSFQPEVFVGTGCSDEHTHEDDAAVRDWAHRPVFWQKPHRGKSEFVRLLGFNDFHGQLSQGRTVSGRPVGGAAVLASYLKTAAADFNRRSLIIHAGDHVGASPPASALLQDEPSIQFLNLLTNSSCSYRKRNNKFCNVVGTLGNHEFDEGSEEMLRLIEGGDSPLGPFLEQPYRGAKFSYVSANVIDANTNQPLITPYTVKQLGKAKVGLIGAVLASTPSIVTPTGVAGLTFQDEVDAINRAVDELACQGIKTIIVTIHQGGTQTSFEGPTQDHGAVTGDILPIIERLDDQVDVVISGHRHSFTNAIVNNANGTPILVTQAFSAGTAYAEIDLEISVSSGDVVAKSAQVITTYSDQFPGNTLDPEVQALVSQAETLTAPLVNRVVGESAVAITRTQATSGESALGNLIADAQRAAVGADFGFMNPGGIRADLDAGTITWGELFTIQPFGNSLVKMNLTGAQVLTLLEQQWVGQTSPRMLQISGMAYTWDEARPVGAKVVSAAKSDGTPLQLDSVYSVGVNSFIAAGGDNFTVLVSGTSRVGGEVDLDALISYVSSLSQPINASIQGRITRLN